MCKNHLTKQERKEATQKRKLRKNARAIKRTDSGFTLLELLIVLAVLVIVVGVGVGVFKAIIS